MAIITFTSDFGLKDHYVAAVKAKIFNYNPNIQVIDISHEVEKFNIPHAVFILNSVFRDFPKGTVHLVAVNSVSAPVNKFIALKLEEHFFVGFDNGILSLLSDKSAIAVEIPNDKHIHSTFPEKSILAFTAVALASGKSIHDIGQPIQSGAIQKLIHRKVKITPQFLEGNIIHIDGFGNAISNITKSDFEKFSKGNDVVVSIKRYDFYKISKNYADEVEGEGFLVFNDQNLLEIGIVKGNAAQLMGLRYDDVVRIEIPQLDLRY